MVNLVKNKKYPMILLWAIFIYVIPNTNLCIIPFITTPLMLIKSSSFSSSIFLCHHTSTFEDAAFLLTDDQFDRSNWCFNLRGGFKDLLHYLITVLVNRQRRRKQRLRKGGWRCAGSWITRGFWHVLWFLDRIYAWNKSFLFKKI